MRGPAHRKMHQHRKHHMRFLVVHRFPNPVMDSKEGTLLTENYCSDLHTSLRPSLSIFSAHLTMTWGAWCLPKVSAVKFIWFVFLTKAYLSNSLVIYFPLQLGLLGRALLENFEATDSFLASFLTNQTTAVGNHWALSGQTEVMSSMVQFNIGCAVQAVHASGRVRGRRILSWRSGHGRKQSWLHL